MTPLRLLLALLLVLPLGAQPLEDWARALERRDVQVSAGLWELSTGKQLEAFASTRALVPASTTKVVSTYALLKVLKPNHVLETEIWGDLQADGAVAGDLVFRGGGDPCLTWERLWALVQALKAQGVQRVRGGLRLDQGAFDAQRFAPGWENTSADTTPPVLPFSVNHNRDASGRITQDPERLALEVLERMLREGGVTVERLPADPLLPAPVPRRLLALPSPPLRQMVQDVNKYSNNFMVEMLVKAFGGGTWPAGVRRIQETCRTVLNLPPEEVVLTDGSGLSKENRLSARTLAIVLRAAWHDFEVGPELVSSLKLVGGEPWATHAPEALARRVRVKSGHLGGVWSLCGYLQRADGEPCVFAVILNGARAREEDVWTLVGRWAGLPSPAGN